MKRVSPVFSLVGIAVVLIAAFIGSTVLVERNAQQVDVSASEIVDNSAPSITELATARTELRRLELGVGHYLSAHFAGLRDSDDFTNRRAAVEQHLATYYKLPMFDDETPLADALERAKHRVYDDVDKVVAAVNADRLDEARRLKIGPLERDSDEVDRLIERLIGVNNNHAAAAATNMRALRARSARLAVLLVTLSVLVGAALLAAAIRAARLYHRALDERRCLAEARARELDQFATRIAHDLKAPLASVVLGATVAEQYPSETQRTLAKIQRASRLMSEMIDALLAVARVEAADRRARSTLVGPVVDVLADEVRAAAQAVNATVSVEPFPATAAVACGSGVLASVLSNLLHNAVKYIVDAPDKRVITLRISDRAACVRFEVHDTGPGVPPKLAEHVFERYVRGERSTGLGLGLATVKHLVESAGGRLGVHSTAGKGSCFWVELPRAAATERAAG
jgi:signal transduction histidine kinase